MYIQVDECIGYFTAIFTPGSQLPDGFLEHRAPVGCLMLNLAAQILGSGDVLVSGIHLGWIFGVEG